MNCPVCASANLTTVVQEIDVSCQCGPLVSYKGEFVTCHNCGEVGDFFGRNDADIDEAIHKSETMLVKIILDDLKSRGIHPPSFERALRLRQRSTQMWLAGNHTPSDLALLRMIWFRPELLILSDNDYYEAST